MISLIVATANNRVIANKNGIPWGKSQKADIDRFRKITDGKTIILGSKTFLEFKNPLPNRKHIVITNNPLQETREVKYTSLEQAQKIAKDYSGEIFVIGGQAVFKEFLPLADKVYLTQIDADYEGTRFFPKLDSSWNVKNKECYSSDANNLHNYCFVDYFRDRI